MLDFSNCETKAYYSLPWLIKEGKIPEKFDIVTNSLFWMRNYYSDYSLEEDEEFICNLIGGSFVSKQRILERYKPNEIEKIKRDSEI